MHYAYADLTGIGNGLDTSDLGVLTVGVTGGSPIPALGGLGWLLAALLAAVGACAIRRRSSPNRAGLVH